MSDSGRDFKKRPFNAHDFERALEYKRLGYTNEAIADALGCHDQTLYSALRSDPDWRSEWDEAIEVGKTIERETTASRARRLAWARAEDAEATGSTPMLIRLFETYVPEAARAQRVEITGDGGGPVQIESKVVSLPEIFAFAESRGIDLVELGRLSRSREALPAAPEVLPEPT